MHTMWKGSISFGLVNIPVKMFAATEDKDIRFKYIHKECKTPIKYEKRCPACDKTINQEDIVRGYEYEPGKFVVIEDKDLDSLHQSTGRAIEILDFVHLDEIDPVFHQILLSFTPGNRRKGIQPAPGSDEANWQNSCLQNEHPKQAIFGCHSGFIKTC